MPDPGLKIILLANRCDGSEVVENSHITEPLLEFGWVQLICWFAKACVVPKVIAVARTIFEKAFIFSSIRKKGWGWTQSESLFELLINSATLDLSVCSPYLAQDYRRRTRKGGTMQGLTCQPESIYRPTEHQRNVGLHSRPV